MGRCNAGGLFRQLCFRATTLLRTPDNFFFDRQLCRQLFYNFLPFEMFPKQLFLLAEFLILDSGPSRQLCLHVGIHPELSRQLGGGGLVCHKGFIWSFTGWQPVVFMQCCLRAGVPCRWRRTLLSAIELFGDWYGSVHLRIPLSTGTGWDFSKYQGWLGFL